MNSDARFEVVTVMIEGTVFWAVNLTLNMEAAWSLKMLVFFHIITWCHNPKTTPSRTVTLAGYFLTL
jgi:hypothetical protein